MSGVRNNIFNSKGNITVEQALAAAKRLISYSEHKHDTLQNYINSNY